MREDIYNYLLMNANDLSIQSIIIGFLAAALLSAVIFVSYRFSHSAAVYSARFNVSLVMVTLVTTLIMSVIGNNVALSLGMVGALSIIRFRTAVKDPRDAVYIFWGIAVGVCCGVQDFYVAGIGSALIFLVMLIIGNVKNNDRFLLVIRGEDGISDAVDEIVNTYYNGKASLKVQNTTKSTTEEIYEIPKKLMDKANRENIDNDIKKQLFEIKGVETVNFVCQNDEINR